MSLLVPKTRKKVYAAPGMPHQNNRYDANADGVKRTKGTSKTMELYSCIERQLGSGMRPYPTTLLSRKEPQTTPQIPITILMTMRR